MKKINEFSLKKFLLTTVITTMTTCFIATIILLYNTLYINIEINSATAIYNDTITNKIKYDSIKEGLEQKFEPSNKIKNDIDTLKEIYGDKYNPESLVYINHLYYITSSIYQDIIIVYIYSISIGIILGTLIYCIFIQKTKVKDIIIKSSLSTCFILFILWFFNIVYNLTVNYIIKKNFNISTNLFNYEIINILHMLKTIILVIIILIIINKIYKKYINYKCVKNTKMKKVAKKTIRKK